VKGGAGTPDSSEITTVKEYKYVASASCRQSAGSQLHADAPIAPFAVRDQRGGRLEPDHLREQRLQGRQGLEGSGGKHFKLELVLIDDPDCDARRLAAGNLARRVGPRFGR